MHSCTLTLQPCFVKAFNKASPHIERISKIIVAMEEDGTLKVLQNAWRIGGWEKRGGCSSIEDPARSRLKSFGGLFSILCGVYGICIGWRLLVKAGQAGAGSCSCIANALACAEGGCNICREASLSRRLSKVSDGSLEHDSS